MSWFKCFVRGEGFPGAIADEDGLVGFYTTRYAECGSADEVEQIVVDSLRNEERLKIGNNLSLEMSPIIIIEETCEIDKSEIKEQGFVFFSENEGDKN